MHDPNGGEPTGEGSGSQPGVCLGGQKRADRAGTGGQGRLIDGGTPGGKLSFLIKLRISSTPNYLIYIGSDIYPCENQHSAR